MNEEDKKLTPLESLARLCSSLRQNHEAVRVLSLTEFALSRVAEEEDKSGLARVLASRGGAFRDVNRPQDAIKMGQASIALNPEPFHAYRLLGAAHYDLRQFKTGEQFLGATITCRTVAGKITLIDSIPKKQARRVYTFAQEVEEQAHQTRRQTEFESLRASASNVTVSAGTAGGTAQPAFDPVQALTKLKTLLDAQLITEAEYAAKKGEILSKM